MKMFYKVCFIFMIAAGLLAFIPKQTEAATSIKIAPSSYYTSKGKTWGQPVSNLKVKDQTGTQDDWNRYVEFSPASGYPYRGWTTYYLPSGITPQSITSLQFSVNYKGPAYSTQVWRWSIFDWVQQKWIYLGNNRSASSWKWSFLNFKAVGTLKNFVSSSGQIRVLFKSNSTVDSADLDYTAIVLTSTSASPEPEPQPGGRWIPSVNSSWQIQLTQLPVNMNVNAQIFDIDLFDNSAETVAALHAKGKKAICYFSAGSWEDWRPDASKFPASVLGKGNGWAGERWLDIRQIAILRPIMEARMDQCKAKGFDAVDPDNVDGYTNATGFPLTAQDQLNYNIFLANAAHARGLSIGLKNDLDQIPQLLPYYDFAVNEECYDYEECDLLLPFVKAGKAVFQLEYEPALQEFCPQSNAYNFNALKKNLDLDVYRESCR